VPVRSGRTVESARFAAASAGMVHSPSPSTGEGRGGGGSNGVPSLLPRLPPQRGKVKLNHTQQLLDDPALTPTERVRVHFLLAQTLEGVPDQWDNARKTYQEVREQYPDDPLAWEAAEHFQAFYDASADRVDTAPAAAQWGMKPTPVAVEAAYLPFSALQKMVNACLRAKADEAEKKLTALTDRYPDDSAVAEAVNQARAALADRSPSSPRGSE
jgi:hypothetical protein